MYLVIWYIGKKNDNFLFLCALLLLRADSYYLGVNPC
jgi:hypothetical protein